MKAKISLGSGGITGLILKHVEKGVVAIAVLLFIFLVWGTSKLGNDFDLKPDQLQNTSVEADKAIREPKPKPEEEVPPWETISDQIRTPVPTWPYQVEKTWMHRLFPGETMRGQPEVFPVEGLRAAAGFGGVAIRPTRADGTTGGGTMEMAGGGYGEESGYGGMGAAGGNAEGRRWVVLTGLLPYKKQWDEYGDVFRNAEIKYPRRDVPQYTLYDVERADVTPGVAPKEGDWKPLNVVKEYYTRRQTWSSMTPEIVYSKFLHRSGGVMPMAYPLPPVVNKEFGAEIAHEPEIPLYYEVERKIEKKEIDWDKIRDNPELLAKAKLSGGQMGSTGGMGMGEEGGYGTGGYETAGYGGDPYGEGSGGYEQDYGGEMGYGMGEMSGMGGYGQTGPRREIPEYQLFRFFDFTVKAGHYYQYRVRIKLKNPNHEIPIQHLVDETMADQAFLDTAWSTESKLVSVPLDSRVLAGPVTVPTSVTSTPSGEIGAIYFNPDDGEEVAEKFNVKRGALLNYPNREVKEEKPKTGMGGYGDPYGGGEEGMYGGDPYGGGEEGMYGGGSRSRDRRRNRQEPEEVKVVDYITEMLLLDFEGGGLLPGTDRSLKAPGRMLLMDPAGNLVIQDDLTNQEEWIEFFPPEVKKDKKKMNEMDPYGEGMYGEESMY